jgi:hypothetical protein
MIKGNFFHLYLKKIKKREEPPIFNKNLKMHFDNFDFK